MTPDPDEHAGDRSYHLLLPKPYLALWQSLGEAAAVRLLELAARNAEDEEKRLKEELRIKKMNTRAPQVGWEFCGKKA